jgi:hypothetical protein
LKKTFDFVFQIVELPLLFYPFWVLGGGREVRYRTTFISKKSLRFW